MADLQQYYGRQLVTILHPEIHTLMISGLVEPQEAAVAVQLVREQFAGRCVAGLSVGSGPQGLQTVMGWSVTEAIQQLELWGAQIIALEGPVVISAMLPIVQCCRKLTSLPLAVFPMAGSPELIDERVDYRLEPADFAEQAAALIEAGVDILGGGRGVDSAHIKSLFELSVSQPNKTKRTSPRKNNE
ncbi:MAG: hypothetical protein HJJLKODD_00580 [Phycisphaerae bacterium]|nr:hypothetical protein [Phycisphaerae bacterium]